MQNNEQLDQGTTANLIAVLDRLSTLLSSMGAMFDGAADKFAVSNSFVAHSIVAATDMVAHAQHMLQEKVEHFGFAESSVAVDELPMDDAASLPGFSEVYAPIDLSDDAGEPLAEQGDVTVIPPNDVFAQSYLELLRKLTTAEIFAAEQQALAPPGTNAQLLPLLRSLREEFQRMHNAA